MLSAAKAWRLASSALRARRKSAEISATACGMLSVLVEVSEAVAINGLFGSGADGPAVVVGQGGTVARGTAVATGLRANWTGLETGAEGASVATTTGAVCGTDVLEATTAGGAAAAGTVALVELDPHPLNPPTIMVQEIKGNQKGRIRRPPL